MQYKERNNTPAMVFSIVVPAGAARPDDISVFHKVCQKDSSGITPECCSGAES